MMESTVNTGMCRCCASEGAFKDIQSTYHWMGEEEIYSDMLRECFDIILNVSEQGEDGGICEVCITQLRNAINFKKQVLHTEEQFKKHLQNKTLFRPNIVKLEMPGDEDSDDNMGSGDDAFSGNEFEVPIKTEVDDPKPKKRAAAKASATTTRASAKKAKADNGETSTKRTQEKTIKKEDIKTDNEAKPKCKKRKKGESTQLGIERKAMKEEMRKHHTNLEIILTGSNATPFLGINYRGYMCCYCDTQYPDPAKLKKHTREEHKSFFDSVTPIVNKTRRNEFCVKLDITDLRCLHCDTDIDTLERLIDHLERDHKKGIHRDIKNQLLPFKFNSDSIKCCICPSIFDKFKSLQQHMHSHYRNFICDVCDMGYVSRGCLKRHEVTHAKGEYKCSYCPKTYDTLRKVKGHETVVHIHKHMVSKCWFCNKKFRNHQTRENHVVEVHGVQSSLFKCRACDRTFSRQRALTIHTQRDHLMERKHKCEYCDKKFFTAALLRHHEVVHTGAREFHCDLCSKTYTRKKSLTEHMKIHNNDRRFHCEHCKRSFVQKCSLKAHAKHCRGAGD